MLSRFLVALLAGIGFLAAPAVTTASGGKAFFSYLQYRPLASAQRAVDGFSPDAILTAYNAGKLSDNGIDGTGQTIAIIAIDRLNMADVQTFDQQNNLPDPTIHTYYVGGTTFPISIQGESDLDVEWSHAMAPGATIQVYYIHNDTGPGSSQELASAVNQAMANGAKIISMSWGACGVSSGYQTAQQALARALSQGVSVFVASGDYGSLAGPKRQCGTQPGVAYPASDPSVVAVGGTSLTTDFNGLILNENGWRLSGGGSGKPLARPSYQVTANLNPGKWRYAPDVAFDGDPQTGVPFVYRGVWHVVGGTSLGAPAWAGIWALIREDAQQAGKTVGAAGPLIYRIGNSAAYSKAFHDVTSGSNGKYSAKPGWDAVTGWGTPNIAGLAQQVIALS
jgi:kumamolisin